MLLLIYMNLYIIETKGSKEYYLADNIEAAAHHAANLNECCLSDYEWTEVSNQYWYTDDIRVTLTKTNLSVDDIIIMCNDVIDSEILNAIIKKKSKKDFTLLDIRAKKSPHPGVFKDGANWAIEELSKRVEEKQAYTWGYIKDIIRSMGFQLDL